MREKSKHEEQHRTYFVSDLDQAKLLADPLRLSILQAFASKPRTTMQVAELLDEKPTKLYRHVDALLEAGLLELKEERPKRGTVERYLMAIAHKFVIDPTLFLPRDSAEISPEGEDFIDSILSITREELRTIPSISKRDDEFNIHPLILRAQIKAPPERIRELRDLLMEWVDKCNEETKAIDWEDQTLVDFAAALFFYPLVKSDSSD